MPTDVIGKLPVPEIAMTGSRIYYTFQVSRLMINKLILLAFDNVVLIWRSGGHPPLAFASVLFERTLIIACSFTFKVQTIRK
ncbi:MAG: hypothetical protein AB2705_22500 [Candidatus Thiodiazotropha sp.]